MQVQGQSLSLVLKNIFFNHIFALILIFLNNNLDSF